MNLPLKLAGCLCLTVLSLASGASHAASEEVTVDERNAILARLNTLLSTEYVDPAAGKRMQKALRFHDQRGDYAALREGQALADRLTQDLREVGQDKHLWIGYRPDGARDEPVAGPSRAELDQWRSSMSRDNFAFDKVERLAGNVGYVKFRVFAYPYLAAETATAAMTFVAHTDALIIDLRDNMGGDPEMVSFIASYLFDHPTRLNDIRNHSDGSLRQYWTQARVAGDRFGADKPVFILTSSATFSAAEDFTYALQANSRAEVIGEPSGGGARPARELQIGKRFTASIPYAESVSQITGKNWERIGVTPDVRANSASAMNVAYRLALEELIKRGGEPVQVQEYRSVLDALPSE
ncbi:S41 family peptidase [Xanthomonas arboricola]|uniref:S41 family peptidase n=1 Tax=Xanthomonas arboricola TaxID=56448 RepID=UPI0009B9531E|nr:S41 family peptidase [Xanthomonas arboricola]